METKRAGDDGGLDGEDEEREGGRLLVLVASRITANFCLRLVPAPSLVGPSSRREGGAGASRVSWV